MSRISLAGALAVAASSAFFSTGALAHITLEQPSAEAGSYYKAVFRVGHGCDGSPTQAITVHLPPGVELTSFIYRKGASLSLRGEADAPDKVYGFIQALEQMALFPEVKSEGISTRNTPRGSRSQFGVMIRLPGTGEGET